MSTAPTVTEIFKHALELREKDPSGSYKELASQLTSEFNGKPFPETAYLTIPEYDNIVPEEDWTAGLSVTLRGIQNDDWNEVILGIIISLEQVENYPKQSGREDDPTKDWRHRSRRIAEAEDKVTEKWMPEDLMAIAKRNTAR